MASERYGIMCPICKDACYLGKTMGGGIYTNIQEDRQMRIIWTFMWKHLLGCHKKYMWGAGDEILFTIIHEGHPDLKFSNGHHWNRHTDDYLLRGEDMKIKGPDNDKLYEMFSAMEKLPYPRDRAFKTREIIKFIHEHYSQQFEIVEANTRNIFMFAILSISLGINSLIALFLFLWWTL